MPKEHTVTTYSFSELSDEAKERAIEKLYDINVDHDWWEHTYEDAERAGLKISSFDIDRGSYVAGGFIQSAEDTANGVIKEHGDRTETYQTAKNFLVEYNKLRPLIDDENNDDYQEAEGELEAREKEFLHNLCEDYRIILQNEYEYLTSETSVRETIEANEYEFTEIGNLY